MDQHVKRKAVIQEQIKFMLKIFAGNLVMGLAYAKWMVPHKIINGGVTSLSLILQRVTHLPLLWLSNGLTLFLLVLCFFFLGKQVFLNSIFSSLCYMIGFSFWYSLPVDLTVNLPVDLALASVFIAFGYYACLSSKATTAGLDVVALMIIKKRPELKVERVIKYINLLVLIFGFICFGLVSIILGVIFTFTFSEMLKLFYLVGDKLALKLKQKEP